MSDAVVVALNGWTRVDIMQSYSSKEILERVFHDDYEHLKGKTLRMTRLRIPGKEVCLAHVFTPTDDSIYQNLGLHIGVHEGEDHSGEAIGIIRFTPWEAVIAAADMALKAADVQIGFMDRFNGSLIITGKIAQVTTAVEETVRYFDSEIGFRVCPVGRS